MTLSDGSKYVGAFKDNNPHGKGTMCVPGGQVIKVIYIDGELVGKQFED